MGSVKLDKNHLVGFLISIIVFIVLSTIYTFTTVLEGMEYGGIDFRFFLRDPIEKSQSLGKGVKRTNINQRARKDIIIIGIDESTIREFSDKGKNWPFDWNIHAKVIKNIRTGEPKSIFFDIMFMDHKPYEKELAEEISLAGNVFLDFPFENEEIGKDYIDQKERMELLNRVRFKVPAGDNTKQLVAEAVPPTPLLTKSAKGIGYANVFPGRDKVNRTMPLILKLNGWYYPNIDLVIVMHFYGIGMNDVEVKPGHYIKLKNIPPEKMRKPNKEREIAIPIDEYGFMDINYTGGAGSFTHHSYNLFHANVIDAKKGNTSIKDKILLVAAYASTGIATDEKKSPYGATFGIEHHANALNTILNQDFLFKMTEFQNLLLMLAIAIIMGLIVSKASIIISVIFTMLFSIFYIFISYLLFDKFSIITAMATPVIQTGLTFTLITAFRVLTEQREKKYIRSTFSKFVSKSVVDELLKHPDKLKLGGDKKILTVLFSDIRGFTSISEKFTPEQLVEHLNVYLQAMTDIVFKYEGTLDKYVGDMVMAFWGAPIPLENHALNASKAAVEMMVVLGKMNESWKAEGKPPLDIGIGLNTGAMVVGNMGSAIRMDYTIMGDNVNLGSRLESTNKIYGTNIIISEFTYEHVRDHVIVRELDLIKVKGKELPVRIYELIDLK